MTIPCPAARLAVAAACAALFVSCGSEAVRSPTAPSGTGPRSGSWRGTLTDTSNVTGTIRLTIEEHAIDAARSFVTGTWSTTFTDASRDGSGTVSGTIAGATGTLLLSPATAPPCGSGPFIPAIGSYSSPMLTVSSVAMQGPYAHATCSGTISGTLLLARP